MDHIVFITKMVHVLFHETVSRKYLIFTLYVYPYMSNGVSHFNLLDELITTFGFVCFFCFFFWGGGGGGGVGMLLFIHISREHQRRT